ncbi:MAG: Lrp/AsnC family transcriptional regulator [Candidatus Hadarchaeales archaeon]
MQKIKRGSESLEGGRWGFGVGLSISGVRRRIKQLEEDEVIKYSVLVNPKKYGYAVTAFVTLQTDPKSIKELAHMLSRKHEVCEIHRTSGGDALIIKLRARDLDSLNRFLDEYISSHDSVKNTTTLIAMETYKESFLNP